MRISLTNGSNTWFDADKAERYKEATRWDGNNWVSIATKSPWYHERLYKTASGKWVLKTWSDYEREPEEYTIISEQTAYDWLTRNGHYEAIPPQELTAREV